MKNIFFKLWLATILVSSCCILASCTEKAPQVQGGQSGSAEADSSKENEVLAYLSKNAGDPWLSGVFDILDPDDRNTKIIKSLVDGTRDLYAVYLVESGGRKFLVEIDGAPENRAGREDVKLATLRVYATSEKGVFQSSGRCFKNGAIEVENARKKYKIEDGSLEAID